MKLEIEKRQLKRFILLYELYKETKGNTRKAIDFMKLAADNGIKNGNYETFKQYLTEEGFIHFSDTSLEDCTITHEGIKIIEHAIMFPKERSENFASFDDMELS
jgi:hypothetical protein